MTTLTKREQLIRKLRLRAYSPRDLIAIALPALAIIALGFYVTAQFIKPAPPHQMTLSSGAAGGAYERFALKYKDVLARYDIELVIQPSAGAIENLDRLRNGEAEAAFIQGGSTQANPEETIRSLGNLYYEPLWIFYRAGPEQAILTHLSDLRGKRIAVGTEGSGTRYLALELLHANGVNERNSRLLALSGVPVAERLQKGQLDAALVVGTPTSALVWQLLYTPGVRLMSLSEAEAYTRRFPSLARLTLPAGSIDLIRHMPEDDVQLVAPAATLAVSEELHPALMGLLLQAASEIHGEAGIFQGPKEFPKASSVDFPLAPEAERYYKSGKPFLQRYLPFWAAILVDRMVVMLIPLLALLVPIFKLAPSLYGWRIRSRIYKRYGELKFLEADIERNPEAHSQAEWLERLDAIESHVNRLPTPLPFSDMLYTLRMHVELVREAILRKTSPSPQKDEGATDS
ncbi:MAG: TAXI family TRAP transporter solute-binding subunit [Rhodocyclaceae bacterium]|nr:TAXI family TRAP transporter solute-binding subunit [Rhodocyclaceae bacterium]